MSSSSNSSLFDADAEDVRESVEFFNSLSDEERALIVSDLNPNTFKIPQYYDSLVHLLSRVQRDITIHDGIKIGNRLMDLGLEETWARLIVANMKKHAPTVSYQVSQLNRMDNQRFAATFSRVMDALWVEKLDDQTVMERYGIDQEQLRCITDMSSHYMQDLMRGDSTEENIRAMLLESGLSKKKVDVLVRSIKGQEGEWYRWLLFRNAQDSFYNTQEIREQNTRILETLREILGMLKDQRSERRTMQ